MEENSNVQKSCIKVGPWGGTGGKEWSYMAKGGIKQIVIRHGGAIDSILLRSDDENGNVTYSSKFGSDGGRADKIDLEWPKEFLTSISGSVAKFDRSIVIRSLCFYSNLTKYGPYGEEQGVFFSFPVENCKIVGFHGRSGDLLDSIGVFVKPILSSFFSSTYCEECSDQNQMKMVKVVGPRGPGPWGGPGGKPFDDGVCGEIKQLQVHVRGGVVHAIQLEYLKRNGDSVWSERHGGAGGNKICKVKLDCENEVLVGIDGFHGKIDGNDGLEVVKSITFYTSKGKYGPFGKESGIYFCSTVSIGKVVGFHGRSGTHLDAIGVYFEYF